MFEPLEACDTRMLIIDEFHNLLGVQARRQRELLNHIRFIGNDRQPPSAGTGLLVEQLENMSGANLRYQGGRKST